MNIFTKLFPTPSFVTISAVGLDFSDATMRFVRLEIHAAGFIPKRFAQVAIPEGCMKSGHIVDTEKFIAFLKNVQKTYNLTYARISIPESQVYSFTLSLDITAKDDIRGAIELVIEDNIPLKSLETVFDFHILKATEKTVLIQVVAVSEIVATNYVDAFTQAGIIPVSFELEGQAITRAVLSPTDTGSCMIVDFGANRTGITIVTNQTAMVTATLEFGGRMLTQKLARELNIPLEEAKVLKREHGLVLGGDNKSVYPILSEGIAVLQDEINRRYMYWHGKKDELGNFPGIDTIYLCGGHSNLTGLADYLSANLKLKVVQVNPWKNCFSLNDFIPEMNQETSMSYVTAIGLSLSDYRYE